MAVISALLFATASHAAAPTSPERVDEARHEIGIAVASGMYLVQERADDLFGTFPVGARLDYGYRVLGPLRVGLAARAFVYGYKTEWDELGTMADIGPALWLSFGRGAVRAGVGVDVTYVRLWPIRGEGSVDGWGFDLLGELAIRAGASWDILLRTGVGVVKASEDTASVAIPVLVGARLPF